MRFRTCLLFPSLILLLLLGGCSTRAAPPVDRGAEPEGPSLEGFESSWNATFPLTGAGTMVHTFELAATRTPVPIHFEGLAMPSGRTRDAEVVMFEAFTQLSDGRPWTESSGAGANSDARYDYFVMVHHNGDVVVDQKVWDNVGINGFGGGVDGDWSTFNRTASLNQTVFIVLSTAWAVGSEDSRGTSLTRGNPANVTYSLQAEAPVLRLVSVVTTPNAGVVSLAGGSMRTDNETTVTVNGMHVTGKHGRYAFETKNNTLLWALGSAGQRDVDTAMGASLEATVSNGTNSWEIKAPWAGPRGPKGSMQLNYECRCASNWTFDVTAKATANFLVFWADAPRSSESNYII